MSYVSVTLRGQIIERAFHSCEYCLIHVDYTTLIHEIDHVIAEKHGGATTLDNLAYACAQCNRNKGSDIAPLTRQQMNQNSSITHVSSSGKRTSISMGHETFR